jgi:hypothetical protein
MTFTATEIHRIHDGNTFTVYGNYVNADGSTGGEIAILDVHSILNVSLQPTGDTVESDAPVVNEEFTGLPPRIDKNSFTMKTVANGCGLWKAEGI